MKHSNKLTEGASIYNLRNLSESDAWAKACYQTFNIQNQHHKGYKSKIEFDKQEIVVSVI